MDAHTAVESWEADTFAGGYAGLDDLLAGGFSGAVQASDTWLFAADGTALAVVADLAADPHAGDVAAFRAGNGTAHRAPGGSVARLAAMLATGGEVRGRYFTDDTPLATVDETLAEGGFTGYVELSENVMSGDYYVVYDEGRAEYVGYVGSTERLLTGEEARERAADEVGVYSVVAVDLPEVTIPTPTTEPGGEAAPRTGPAATETAATEEGATEEGAPIAEDPSVDDEPSVAEGPSVDDEPSVAEEPPTGDAVVERSAAADANVEAAIEAVDDRGDDADEETAGVSVDTAASTDANTGSDVRRNGEPDDRRDDEAVDRRDEAVDRRDEVVDRRATPAEAGPVGEGSDVSGPDGGVSEPDVESLRAELARVRSERDELEARLADLEAGGAPAVPSAAEGVSKSPAEALAGTSLFVRTESRGGATLADAHAGEADLEEVRANLRVEYHTRFDDEGATVDGEPFERFLRSSTPYRFAEWLSGELLFEIGGAGAVGRVEGLYDALPRIDRVAFHDRVATDDAEDGPTFDVVARDRRGNPLVVANLDDSRDPTSADWMQRLVEDAMDVAGSGGLAAAFGVTSSYFEPAAVSTATEATSGSLLGRDRRDSYVKMGRKRGFHLCLVEARDEAFHLTVPDL